MRVGIVGEDPGLAVLRDQIAGLAATVRTITPAEAGDVDVVVASDAVDGDTLDDIHERIVANGSAFVAIERGGIGGRAISTIDASVAFLSGGGPCYRCLRLRAAAGAGAVDQEPGGSATTDRIAGAHAGARLARMLRGDGFAAGEVLTVPVVERRVLPVPGCPDCDPPGTGEWREPGPSSDRDLADAIAAAERFLDELIGPVSEIGEARTTPLPYYLASLADTEPFSDAGVPSHAAGVAEDWNLAFMKAMGEALERYAAACYREAAFRRARPGALPDAMSIDRCVRPADRDPIADAIPWVPARRLADGASAWLPAELVVFPPPERAVRPAITTGLALGNTPAATALSGLLEVIERDATMLAWYSTFEPMGLEVDDERFAQVVRRAATADLDVAVTLLTQDVDVPVVGAFVSRAEGFPGFAAGSAAGFDAAAAATDALREALQNWMELAELGADRATEEEPRLAGFASERTPPARLVDPPVTVSAADVGPESAPTPAERLDTLVDRASQADMTPYVSWLTTRDLRAEGFSAARVVVPEAQPLLLETTYFGDRARTVPDALGFTPRLDRGEHPFP